MRSTAGIEHDIYKMMYATSRTSGKILFLGASYNSELSPDVLDIPWECVFTTSTDPDLGVHFIKKQNDIVVRNAINVPSVNRLNEITDEELLDRANLHIVRLCGMDAIEVEERHKVSQKKILNKIQRLFRYNYKHLIVLGLYQDTEMFKEEAELWDDILMCFEGLPKKAIYAFGVTPNTKAEVFFNELNQDGQYFSVYSDSLASTLSNYRNREVEYEDYEDIQSDSEMFTVEGKHIYINGRRYEIPYSVFQTYFSYATVLTVEDLTTQKYYGRDARREGFRLFMRNSISSPQWYGYANGFYFERFFESELREKIVNQLKANKNSRPSNCTINLLIGDPASSKSITLAAIAYKIFFEEQFPVVWINSGEWYFEANSSDFDRGLNELLAKVERPTESVSTPLLLIWDGSHSSIDKITKLADALDKARRNVVLLCSMYEQQDSFYKSFIYPSTSDRIADRRDFLADGHVYRVVSVDRDATREYNIVKATRKLSPEGDVENGKESFELTKLFREFFPEYNLSLENNEDSNNLFLRLYHVLEWLIGPLSGQLSSEMASILSSGHLPTYFDLMSRSESVIEAAFRLAQQKAKLDSSFFNIECDSSNTKEIPRERFEMLTTFIALFTRFRLETPTRLALSILQENDSGKVLSIELIQGVLSALPWINFKQASKDSGVYMLAFREYHEALDYLKRTHVNSKKKVDCILHIMDYLLQDYIDSRQITDQSVARQLEKLLEYVGPNSKVTDYVGTDEQREFERYYPDIIKKLDVLRQNGVLDIGYAVGLLVTEITYIRECNSIKQRFGDRVLYQEEIEDTNKRLDNLWKLNELFAYVHGVLSRAYESLRDARDPESFNLARFIRRRLHSLTVEQVTANGYINNCRNANGTFQQHAALKNPAIRWTSVKDNLMFAIADEPESSHYYAAMLRIFEEDTSLKEAQELEAIFRIHDILTEMKSTPEIAGIVLQSLELKDRISRFEARRQKVNGGNEISIDWIKKMQDFTLNDDETTSFYEYFRRLTEEEKKPDAVLYVAQEELKSKSNPINLNEFLREEVSRKKIQKVLDWMENYNSDKYQGMINKNKSCLFLKIQLKWALMNWDDRDGTIPILPYGKKLVLPRLNSAEWNEIEDLCEKFMRIENSYKSNIQGFRDVVIGYLYALAKAELKDYYASYTTLNRLNRSAMRGGVRSIPFYVISDWDGSSDSKGKQFNVRPFSGIVVSHETAKTGYIKIVQPKQFPNRGDKNDGIWFHAGNLFSNTEMPKLGTTITDLQLGISMGGFSLYTEEGRLNQK